MNSDSFKRWILFGYHRSHLRDCCQTLSPESFRDLGQSGTSSIGEPQPGWGVCPEDSILGGEIFDVQQQILIH